VTFTRRSEFVAGIRDTVPMVVGAIPFGLIFGITAINNGISPAAAMGLSLFVFAGSSQFIAAALYGQGVGILLIVLTTFIVNLRHMLYSVTLSPHLKGLGQKWLVPLGFWLTDETFVTMATRLNKGDASPYKHWYQFGSSVMMYLPWNISTLIGILAGQAFPDLRNLGLDFALVATFIGMVISLVKTRPLLLAALVAGVSAVLLDGLPNRMSLLVAALLGVVTGVLAEQWFPVPVQSAIPAEEN
jgi:4-azaleucine resistance transporter AzlC